VKIEICDDVAECHECGHLSKNYTLIWLDHLCQHFVCFCPSCLKKFLKEIKDFLTREADDEQA